MRATSPPLDADRLRRAVVDADLRVLVMCLFHATGDRRWLSDPYRPRRDVRLIADEDAGFSPDIESRIRNAAIEVFGALDQSPAITDPGDELMVEMMRWCMNEEIDAAYAPMMREDLGFTPRDVEITSELAADRHVLVIGAGASGIVLGARLKRMGVPFTILERATDVGGTWRDNIYPGCGVDTPNHAYSYSIGAREPWTRTFSPQPELLAYLQRCTDEFGVRDHIRFDSEVVGCRWDDDDHTWELSTRSADGHTTTATGTDVVVAIGHFGKPSTPDLPGADLFTGPMFHTARWPADIDLTGKRVVIVGTGASAMQIVPSIVDQVGHLTVIQRSPQWVRPIPRYHEDLSDDTQWLLANVPFYAEWFRFTMLWRYGDGLLPFLKKDPDWPFPERSLNRVNERHRQQMVDHIHAELGDRQDLIDVCTPTYPPYGKRILLDNGWYQALLRPNVSLAVGEVTEITASGVVTDEGVEHAADVIVMSTGFRITDMARVVHPVGRDGITLDDVWGYDDATAHLGITVPGFPNFFLMLGPSTGLGHGGSAIFQSESQTRYITDAIAAMAERSIASIEPKQRVHDEYVRLVDERHSELIWSHPGMTTYYRNSVGRVVSVSPFSLLEYWQMTHDVDLADFIVTPA